MTKSLNDYRVDNAYLTDLLKISDLHLHTFYSDGEIDPKSLLEQAAQNNLKYISITDHNEFHAYEEELFNLANKLSINLLPGSEIDCGSGLDILVYDNDFNKISPEFLEFMRTTVTAENEERIEAAKKSLSDIREYLFSGKAPSWFNVSKIDLVQEGLTIENLQKINLKTGKFDLPKREYLSKPHIIKLLDALDLINWDDFVFQNNFEFEKRDKQFKKFLFKNVTTWKYNDHRINEKLIESLVDSGFTLILAHPGKTYFDIFDNQNPTAEEFKDFVSNFITKYSLNGAEADYRRYHEQKFDYNKMTIDVLTALNGESTPIIATAGSDRHQGF